MVNAWFGPCEKNRQHMASGYQRNEFGFGPYKTKHIHIDCVNSPLSGLRNRFGSTGIFIFLHTGDIIQSWQLW